MVIRIDDVVLVLDNKAVWNESIKSWSMDATGLNGRKYRCFYEDQGKETLDAHDLYNPYCTIDITKEKK